MGVIIMCQHDFRQPDDTLTLLPIRRMVSPGRYILQCKECGQIICVNENEVDKIETFIIRHTPINSN